MSMFQLKLKMYPTPTMLTISRNEQEPIFPSLIYDQVIYDVAFNQSFQAIKYYGTWRLVPLLCKHRVATSHRKLSVPHVFLDINLAIKEYCWGQSSLYRDLRTVVLP